MIRYFYHKIEIFLLFPGVAAFPLYYKTYLKMTYNAVVIVYELFLSPFGKYNCGQYISLRRLLFCLPDVLQNFFHLII